MPAGRDQNISIAWRCAAAIRSGASFQVGVQSTAREETEREEDPADDRQRGERAVNDVFA
jgi:hypothetical protein